MSYYEKYLKYKEKYLQLKESIKGGLRSTQDGLSRSSATYTLPPTITDNTPYTSAPSEGRCMVIGCQCTAFNSKSGKTIQAMFDPHPQPERAIAIDPENYNPVSKPHDYICTHCKHTAQYHALDKEMNKNYETISLIPYHEFKDGKHARFPYKLYEQSGDIFKLKSPLGLEYFPH